MGDSENLPQTIGRYQVQRLLGGGAMGSVVLAEDPKIKRKVAIKLVKLDSVRNEADRHEFLMRFQREAEVSGVLNHPGIVAIYDVGEEDGLGPFLAMEYVAGKPLDSLIKGTVPMSLKEKLRIAAGIAEALDHAHAKGIVHRDVKPGNVMVGEDGRPKLMDFGIAKREDANLTQTGTFLGTPSYASPEQIKEGTVDGRSDIFSFGVLVFELMSGQSPFPGASINTILYRIVNEPPVEVQPPVLGVLPDGWRRVFDRVLAKKPEDRHPSCAAFIRDLMEAVVEIGKEDRRELMGLMHFNGDAPLPQIVSRSHEETLLVQRPAPKRGPWPLLMGAAAVAVLAVGGWFLFRGARGTRLQINTTPPGAQVFVNDLEVGTTPTNQSLREGDRLRMVLKGFRPFTYAFKPGVAPPTFPLEPIVSDEVIDSQPQGAAVVLDEKPLEGVTPLKVHWNQGVSHRLTLTKEQQGFQWDFAPGEVPGGKAFALKDSGAAASVEPALDPNAPGTLKLSGGFGVRVKVDGKDLGELVPGGTLAVTPGTHKVDLANAKVFYRDSRSITVTAGQPLALAVPGLATLIVETFPGTGRVAIDGQDAGIESDGSSVKVSHGHHTVTIRSAGGTRTEPVEVNGDKHLKIPL
ncbi:MAG TPA: serine/threonine-protein kinase [Holophagaceae bacterium]